MLTVAVLGAGLMGTGIAGVAAGAGHRLRLYDADADASARAAAELAWPGHRHTRTCARRSQTPIS